MTPALGRPLIRWVELGVGIQLLEKSFMVNVVEASFDVSIEHTFRFVSDAVEDGSDRVVT